MVTGAAAGAPGPSSRGSHRTAASRPRAQPARSRSTLLHVSGAQRLTDDVRSAHDEHVPAARRLVGVAAADHGADAGERLVQYLLVRARRLASWLLLVAPRPAENPVVQSLAALAQPRPGPSFGPVM